MTPLIQARGLRKVYSRTHWWQKRLELPALDNVDLAIQSGQTMALVGQSGSGKTTLAMCLVGLERTRLWGNLVRGQEIFWRRSGKKDQGRIGNPARIPGFRGRAESPHVRSPDSRRTVALMPAGQQ